MKRIIILVCLLTVSMTVFGQKYMTRTGTITFLSDTPLEKIEAINNQVASVINLEDGQLAFSLLMKAFTFEKALMQEHFNEKYIESDKYPKATFKGKILDYDRAKIGSESQEFTIEGTLTIHGESQEVKATATLIETEDGLNGQCKFEVNLADFNIKIPAAVRENISKSVDIIVDVNYDKM